MVLLSSAISLLLLCSAHALPFAKPRRSPTITVPLKHHRIGKAKDLANASRARARSFVSSGKSAPATNVIDTYTVTLAVGNQEFASVIVDTGSSNTWVGALTTYIPSSTSQNTGAGVSVEYGSGNFTGTEFTDTVSLGDVTVIAQSIGVANFSIGFDGFDGIIGFGPVGLTNGTVEGTPQVQTFMQNLVSQGQISANVMGISFEPENGADTDDVNGELTFGGIDGTKFTGNITYVPLSQVFPVNQFWGIDDVSATFGSSTLAESFSAIVDTGTTVIVITDSVFESLSSVSGATIDENTGLVVFPTRPTDDFIFSVGGTSFTLTPEQYLVPANDFETFGLQGDSIFSFFFAFDDPTEPQTVGIMGQKFLENFYSVYDTDNAVVGLALRN